LSLNAVDVLVRRHHETAGDRRRAEDRDQPDGALPRGQLSVIERDRDRRGKGDRCKGARVLRARGKAGQQSGEHRSPPGLPIGDADAHGERRGHEQQQRRIGRAEV
jgi:hypothetical protein